MRELQHTRPHTTITVVMQETSSAGAMLSIACLSLIPRVLHLGGGGGAKVWESGLEASMALHCTDICMLGSTTVVMRLPPILRCGREVTAVFRWSEIVTLVAAISIPPIGVTTPCDAVST